MCTFTALTLKSTMRVKETLPAASLEPSKWKAQLLGETDSDSSSESSESNSDSEPFSYKKKKSSHQKRAKQAKKMKTRGIESNFLQGNCLRSK